MKYFRIKNWEKYQHRDAVRGDGPMRWIRVETGFLRDQKMFELTPLQQLTWIKLLLYSGLTRNKLEYNSVFLKAVLHLSRKPNLALFEELGLIEQIDLQNMPAEMPARCAPTGHYARARAQNNSAKAAVGGPVGSPTHPSAPSDENSLKKFQRHTEYRDSNGWLITQKEKNILNREIERQLKGREEEETEVFFEDYEEPESAGPDGPPIGPTDPLQELVEKRGVPSVRPMLSLAERESQKREALRKYGGESSGQ